MTGHQLVEQVYKLRLLGLIQRTQQADLHSTHHSLHFQRGGFALGRDPQALAASILHIGLAPDPAFGFKTTKHRTQGGCIQSNLPSQCDLVHTRCVNQRIKIDTYTYYFQQERKVL